MTITGRRSLTTWVRQVKVLEARFAACACLCKATTVTLEGHVFEAAGGAIIHVHLGAREPASIHTLTVTVCACGCASVATVRPFEGG